MSEQSYRPANGSEGDWFMSRFCYRCEKDRTFRERKGPGCAIAAATMVFNPGDPEYPPEWIFRDGEPTCTAFVPSTALEAE